ncbi:hypothetical protein Q0Z83_050230 [Actinoplanes sichuanensis]|uniref:Uncharacterized protein n=1 Tax=Actinoplanes sichuanensis TaxID=512349 RepID=A0ABW4AN20_9ACTN|nr:hypothetical protein [Actinoplanes sichuanensis]BEL06832.1 hypothetical protein Q0Z83_050230 [Actinoplanes sichuanensis]
MSDEERRARAVELLSAAAAKAKRAGNVPFAPAFVISAEDGEETPLARLIKGGRGGQVRLKLYLCITMMATSPPYDLRNAPTPASWARLLGLDPDTGPRRVSSNLRWLADNGFISLRPRPGSTAVITLLNPTVSRAQREFTAQTGIAPRRKYERPSGKGRYIGVPVELWTKGWILDLSTTGLAILMVLMELQGGHAGPRYVTRQRHERYGLSTDTWTRARKELERHQLLTVTRTPQGSDFDYQRMRNLYRVHVERMKTSPEASARHSV